MEWVGGQVPAVQERNMAGIDADLDRLQVVALLPPLGGDAMRRGQMHPLEVRQRRLPRRRAHVGPDDAAQLHARVRLELDALAYAAFLRLGGQVHALAVHVVLPPVVRAAQPALLVAAEPQRHAAMGAELVDQADSSVRIAERDQLLSEQFYANGGAVALRQLPVEQRGYPIAPEQLAHRRAGARAGQEYIHLLGQHGRLPFQATFHRYPSSFAHPGAVDIDLTAECDKLGQLARALHLVQGPQELREPRCALRAGDRLDVLAQLLIEVRVGKGILVVPGERPRIAMHDCAVVELDLDARQIAHLHALVLAHGVRAQLQRRRANDLLDERLALRVENHIRREARHPDGTVQDRGRDDIGQRMIGGLARDGIPRVLAYLDQGIVGALLGEHAYLFDPGKILDPGPSVNGGLYGALRHGADRPALHERLVHPAERDARVQPLAQHGNRVVLHIHFLHEAALPDERSHRRFDADLREETGLERIPDGVGCVETLPHGKIAALVELARFDLIGCEMGDRGQAHGFAGLVGIQIQH